MYDARLFKNFVSSKLTYYASLIITAPPTAAILFSKVVFLINDVELEQTYTAPPFVPPNRLLKIELLILT